MEPNFFQMPRWNLNGQLAQWWLEFAFDAEAIHLRDFGKPPPRFYDQSSYCRKSAYRPQDVLWTGYWAPDHFEPEMASFLRQKTSWIRYIASTSPASIHYGITHFSLQSGCFDFTPSYGETRFTDFRWLSNADCTINGKENEISSGSGPNSWDSRRALCMGLIRLGVHPEQAASALEAELTATEKIELYQQFYDFRKNLPKRIAEENAGPFVRPFLPHRRKQW